MNPQTQAEFRDYLNVGGKLIFSGTPGGPAAATQNAAPGMRLAIANYNLNEGSWATTVFHTSPITPISPYITSLGLDFGGAKGQLGYSDVALDPSKIAPDSVAAHRNIGSIGLNFPQGFAETIFLFNSRSDGLLEDRPLGVRFLAPQPIPPARQTYSVVFFWFSIALCTEISDDRDAAEGVSGH
jgi:hypothetical protein